MSCKTEAEINAEKAAKPALDVTPPELMLAAGRALGYGKAKHGVATSDGWGTWRVAGTQQAEPLTHYACLLRHLLLWRAGEERDAESGLSHLDHAAAQLAILLDLHARPVAAQPRTPTGEPPPKDPNNDEDWPLPEGWEWTKFGRHTAIRKLCFPYDLVIASDRITCGSDTDFEAFAVLKARVAAGAPA